MDTDTSWTCSDDEGYPYAISAESAEEAARVFASEADWPTESKTYWVEVLVQQASSSRMDWAKPCQVAIEPQEPACEYGHEHEYEEGTVWGHGGGVVVTERCAACGLQRITDTWAQCRATGKQGLEATEYRAAEDADFE